MSEFHIASYELEYAKKRLKEEGVGPEQTGELLSLLKADTEPGLLEAALIMLLSKPVPVSLETIEPIIFHEKTSIQERSLLLLGETRKEEGLPLYEKAYKKLKPALNCHYFARHYLMQYASEKHVPLVARWVEKRIGKNKSEQVDLDNQTERVRVILFLVGYPEKEETQRVLNKSLEFWEYFADEEASWLLDRVEFFNRPELQRPRVPKPVLQVPISGNHPVFAACKKGDVATVRDFLDQGGSLYSCPEDDRTTLAAMTVNFDQLPVLQLLCERGLDINRPPVRWPEPLIVLAYEKGRATIVDYLLERGADIDLKKGSLVESVFGAAKDPGMIEKLLRKGADVRWKDSNKRSMILIAASKGDIPMMEFLLKAGANIEDKNFDYSTPLILAIEANHVEAVRWLLDQGANIENRGWSQKTPVMFAMEARSDRAILELLLSRGARLESKDKLKRSVITLAFDFYGGDVKEIVRKYLPSDSPLK